MERKKKYRLKKKWADLLFAIQMWLSIIFTQIIITLAIYLYLAGY